MREVGYEKAGVLSNDCRVGGVQHLMRESSLNEEVPMRRPEVTLALVLAVLVLLGCGGQTEQQMSAGAAYEQAQETLETLDDPQEEVQIFEEFVRAYPDSEEAIDALGAVIYLRSKKLDDLDGAVSFAEAARSVASDPKTRFEYGIKLHDISVQAGHPVDLRMIADELAAERPLNFVEHLSVVEEGEKAGAWELVFDHATSMGQFANAETFRSDYPDDDFSDEESRILCATPSRVGCGVQGCRVDPS